jgi:hypothetical protein
MLQINSLQLHSSTYQKMVWHMLELGIGRHNSCRKPEIFKLKTVSRIAALLLAGCLAAAVQAHATGTTLTFTETINNIDAEVYGTPYNGTFTDANLKSGSTVFNSSLYTITSATVDITMLYAAGHEVYLTIDGTTQNQEPHTSPQILAYTLTSTQDSYIQAEDGTFNFGVLADCELENAELIITATSKTTQIVPVPDAASAALLLGGSLSALGLLKRKLR